jgi:hypothetical protein
MTSPVWEEVRREVSGTKITITAKSGARVTTKEFLNEFQAEAFDWEADFKFALLKASTGRMK